ncbi:MAG: Spore coat protein CotH [Oscillospiraceae bacterium]|jgi:spore coat protein CotH
MSTHKNIDKICLVAVILSILISIVFINGEALGIQAASKVMGYENRLFDTSKVHTIDIVMDDWDEFLETCEDEEYTAASVVIDGEAYKNVGIRAKGNSSLSSVSAMDSDRYSFKIEFDHYDNTTSYYGLDKISLNNIIKDNTYMKDYLTYQMMADFGVNAPLSSYVYITVNGEDWGLYLAVEEVEDSFLQRNYGTDYGELYKPDTASMGGGRGNGKNFNMDDFLNADGETDGQLAEEQPQANIPADGQVPEGLDPPIEPGNQVAGRAQDGQDTGMGNQSPMQDDPNSANAAGENAQRPAMPGNNGNMNGGGMGGGNQSRGSEDTKLQYIDDDPDSYPNIFDNAKTDISEADENRLIASLKALNEGEDLDVVLDMDQLLRYFVVHNFVVNGDSYTGYIIHNYYLYEEDGKLSMIPWDYNEAFGTFQNTDANSAVNDDIDNPLTVTGEGDRPMFEWIFSSDEYTESYHQYFESFLNTVDYSSIIEETAELIAPYVEKDPTKFCTYEEFETGVSALKEFCSLREESIRLQLAGEEANVDTSSFSLADLSSSSQGTMDRQQPNRGEVTAP